VRSHPASLQAVECRFVSEHILRLVIAMKEPQPADPFAPIVTELALSTARLRVMAAEAHALVEHLKNRPPVASVKKWAVETNRPGKH
jgi:hypothetical protein